MSNVHSAEEQLRKWLSDAKRTVIAGIGNPICKDDSVGVRIVQELRGKVSANVLLIEAETVPESYMQQIANFSPTHVLLIDAAVLGLKPGELKLVEPEELTMFPAFSTHALPLRIFCEYLAKTIQAHIALLLIQPKDADFGEGLTPELEASARGVVRVLLDLL